MVEDGRLESLEEVKEVDSERIENQEEIKEEVEVLRIKSQVKKKKVDEDLQKVLMEAAN